MFEGFVNNVPYDDIYTIYMNSQPIRETLVDFKDNFPEDADGLNAWKEESSEEKIQEVIDVFEGEM